MEHGFGRLIINGLCPVASKTKGRDTDATGIGLGVGMVAVAGAPCRYADVLFQQSNRDYMVHQYVRKVERQQKETENGGLEKRNHCTVWIRRGNHRDYRTTIVVVIFVVM